MGRKTISNQIHSALADKIAFGESKHLDKIERETSSVKALIKSIPSALMIHTIKSVVNMGSGSLKKALDMAN